MGLSQSYQKSFLNLVSPLYLLSLTSIIKLGCMVISYANLAKIYPYSHPLPHNLFWLILSFDCLIQGTQNFPLVNVSGWVNPAISILFYFNPKYHNETTYWSLEVLCRGFKEAALGKQRIQITD